MDDRLQLLFVRRPTVRAPTYSCCSRADLLFVCRPAVRVMGKIHDCPKNKLARWTGSQGGGQNFGSWVKSWALSQRTTNRPPPLWFEIFCGFGI